MILVIDFGTTKTVAVLGTGRQVTFDGTPWLATAVLAGADALVVGEDAVHLGRTADGVARAPTSGIDGGEPVVRAVLERVVAAAFEQAGEPVTELVLTHPAGWTEASLGVLLGAAHGLAPKVRPVPAPVAAAAGQALPAGTSLLVVDMGGGVTEVAVVRQEQATAKIVSSQVLALGGDDLDQRIVDRVLPSLRAPAGTPRERWLLLEAARAAKEQLSRHESAEVVLPDHRAVRLTRAEFERLIAQDVDRIVALATAVEHVLLVGGSSRVPLLARRLAEVTGRPVLTDPEPDTVVARGALTLVTEDNGEPAQSDVPSMGARSPGVVALALLMVAVLTAVLLIGTEPKPTAGKSVPAAATGAPNDAVLPPAPVGTEVVGGPSEFQVDPVPVGMPVRLESAGATIDVQLDSYRAVPAAPEPAGRAPDGYRWLLLKFHLANVAGDDWRVRLFERVAAVDDRGQMLWAVGNGQVPCSGHGGTTLGVKAGAEIDACGVVPVPDATPVVAVTFSFDLTLPVSVPAVADAPVPGTSPPAANLITNGIPVHARADVVATPSAYFDGLEPPLAGTRYVVARLAMSVGGKRDLLPINSPYLLDDRGALLKSAERSWDLPGCRQQLLIVHPGEPDWGCYVFVVDADVPVAGVTWGPDAVKFGEWPRWTAG